jgi:hypothetical protein
LKTPAFDPNAVNFTPSPAYQKRWLKEIRQIDREAIRTHRRWAKTWQKLTPGQRDTFRIIHHRLGNILGDRANPPFPKTQEERAKVLAEIQAQAQGRDAK